MAIGTVLALGSGILGTTRINKTGSNCININNGNINPNRLMPIRSSVWTPRRSLCRSSMISC